MEVKAVPVSQKKTSLQQEQVKKPQRIPGSPAITAVPSNTDKTFGGLASPKLDVSYEPMIVKEARYIAITMMKVTYFTYQKNFIFHYLTNFQSFKFRHKIIGLENCW